MDAVSKAQAGSSEKTARIREFSWKKGQSGNPSGRPKKLHISKMFEKVLAKPQNRKEIEEAIMLTLTSKGMAKVLMLREMAERTEGKVADTVDLNVTGTIQLANVIEQRRKKRAGSDSQS